jgi:hypothetical protein
VSFSSLHDRRDSSLISVTLVFGKGSLLGQSISLSVYNLIMADSTGWSYDGIHKRRGPAKY